MLHPAGHPHDLLFRRMIVLSVGLHAAAAVAAAAWTGLVVPAARLAPVAVVDLVGIGSLAEKETPAPEVAAPKAAPPPVRKGRDRAPKARAREPKAAAEARPAPPPDARDLSEALRKLRERKVDADQVDEAVSTIRKTLEARGAVGRIREKQARRVDLSALARPAAAPAAGSLAGAGGAARAKVSPDDLAYFRALDDKVRSNWTLPSAARGDVQAMMVQLRITIEMDGRVSDVVVEKSSGNAFFDDSVFRAIRKASPLPVPPEKLRGGEDRYEVGFRFYGGDGTT